ncbi:MAG: hypothetical protein JWP16_1295 [Alphaproteobacteria bacterium]|jgi:hypothetical protein|nr:hypothetical protein [Alphaproteobacteria bacterium]
MKHTLTAVLLAAGLALALPATAQTADGGAMKMDHDTMAKDKMAKDKMDHDKMDGMAMSSHAEPGSMAMKPMKKTAKKSTMPANAAMAPAPANAMTH